MAMLSRYQKAGGFLQLLQLIETCGKQKQENFLQMIDNENARWGGAIREKMLTIDKVLAWPDDVIGEISGRLQHLTLATALHGLKEEDRNRLLVMFSHSQKRTIEDLFKAKSPTQPEISSSFIKILQEVRTMLQGGYLRPEKYAPELPIPEDYEDHLGKAIHIVPAETVSPSSTLDSSNPTSAPAASAETEAPKASRSGHPQSADAVAHNQQHDKELNQLRAKIQTLTHENNQLKNELQVFRDKLAQIKRIA
jgi:hypothetical protein